MIVSDASVKREQAVVSTEAESSLLAAESVTDWALLVNTQVRVPLGQCRGRQVGVAAHRLLARRKGGQVVVVIEGCRYLSFTLF